MPWYIGCWGYMLILAELRLSDRIMGLVPFREAVRVECICGNVGLLPFLSPLPPDPRFAGWVEGYRLAEVNTPLKGS